MNASKPRRSLLPLLFLGGAVLFWGTSFVALKSALGSFSPMTVIWLRMLIATVVFAPFWRRIPRPDYRAGDWKVLLLAALCIPCLYYLFEGYALQFTTSSQAGVISAIVPLLVAGGAWLFLHERLTWRGAVAIALSLGGVAALSLGGTAQENASAPLLGNSLELLAMVAAAGSMIAIKHLSMRYDPWLLTGLQAAVGTLFFAPMAFASNPTTWLAATPVAWACVTYLGIACEFGSVRALQLGAQAATGKPRIPRHQPHSRGCTAGGLGGSRRVAVVGAAGGVRRHRRRGALRRDGTRSGAGGGTARLARRTSYL